MRIFSCFIFLLVYSISYAQDVGVVIQDESPRITFGGEKLVEKLESSGYRVSVLKEPKPDSFEKTIILQSQNNFSDFLAESGLETSNLDAKESFKISSSGDIILVQGADNSGVLYGALQLGDFIEKEGKYPNSFNIEESPEMVLRGSVIGLQKTELMEGRGVYEYPYTPENFPWFYDKELWIDYLDMMVENRLNSLYLWNGHPFASLVKLDDYPYAVEVDDETFQKNEEIFRFLTEEADKRGIWVIQMFYNIIVSKPFAEHHNIETQDRSREITPLLEDYTRKSIAAFIEKYPNVGLLVALGEAMSGIDNDINWFTNTVIPGVKDGLKALNIEEEPPIILRAHDTDAPEVMEEALKVYKNLYTTHKYNGESLTTYEPRGPWTQIHRDLSSAGSIHISNVHILANLEPFRFGSPDFIQKSVKAMHNEHGANALHLYPQVSYWDWPYTPDKTNDDKRLLEMDRDWIWYKAWSRYAWEKDRDRKEEIEYWSELLAEKFGASEDGGKYILKAYEETGEIAPKTLRRFGITEGNRQTLLLGMFASQLVNPYKWRVYPGFYESCGPLGEILIEYADKEWNNEPHFGETPPQIIEEILAHSREARSAIDKATPLVSEEKEEFKRLKNDVYAYEAFTKFFSEKVKAALKVLRYEKSGELSDLEEAVPHLEKSLEHYRDLVALTKDTYHYANSMQTSMRRIPISGEDGKNKHWTEILPHFEEELSNFKNNLASLKESGGKRKPVDVEPWKKADVIVTTEGVEKYSLETGELLYPDMNAQVLKTAPELKNLRGLKIDPEKQQKEGTSLSFKTENPVKVVVGYFNSEEKDFLSPPTLETNAAANNRGQADAVLVNSVKTDGYPPINIHTYNYEPGEHTLSLGKGKVLILGFIDANQELSSRDVGYSEDGDKKAIDWLFY